MIKLMKFKVWFFVASTLIILPGIYFIFIGGLKFGIDFTGGALLEYKFEKQLNKDELDDFGTVVQSGENTYIVRTQTLSNQELQELKKKINEKFGNFEVRREEM